MNLERRHDETDIQYHKRLVFGKMDDKTLSDVDYSELSGYLYGRRYSSDTARRMVYGSYRTLMRSSFEKLSYIFTAQAHILEG